VARCLLKGMLNFAQSFTLLCSDFIDVWEYKALSFTLLCCVFGDMQEWKTSFTAVQAAHEQVQQSGQNVILFTARLGQDDVGHELRDLAAQLASLCEDSRRLEASLESSLRAYEEFDRTSTALTEWLVDVESHLEQLNRIDFLASDNLKADCKVPLSSLLDVITLHTSELMKQDVVFSSVCPCVCVSVCPQ